MRKLSFFFGNPGLPFAGFLILGVVLNFSLLTPVLAQDTGSTEPSIERETPVNVPELVNKVKKGVISINALSSESPIIAAETALSGGSGFVIDKDGHAITNTHVAGDTAVMQVILWDLSKYKATLVARAPGYDIALIKIHNIPSEKLFPVPLGDSDSVKPGDLALAMGSPGASQGVSAERSDPLETWLLKQTATLRVIVGRETSMEFQVGVWNAYRSGFGLQYATNLPYIFRMQTPINPGNSGGPLFNRFGEVIGVNTWGGGGTLIQQSFSAVPVNAVKVFVEDIMEGKRHEVPWLGLHVVFPGNITRVDAYIEFKQRFRKPGLHVYAVEKGSPAERAGLLPDDEILTVNGRWYEVPEDFRMDVLVGRIGQEYVLQVRRGNRTFGTTLYSEAKPPWIWNFSV